MKQIGRTGLPVRAACALLLLASAAMHASAVVGRGPAANTGGVASVPTTAEEALAQLARQAGIIFAGQVSQILSSPGFDEVRFHVEEPVLGVHTSELSIRLWHGTDLPFQPGQRAIFFFHALSPAGLTSLVGGQDGILPPNGDKPTGSVDLRWVAARVLRDPMKRTQTPEPYGPPDVAASAAVPQGGTAFPAGDASGALLGAGLESIDRTIVTGLLHAWARAGVAH